MAEGLDDGIAASRLLFHPDGTLFMRIGGSYVFAQTGSTRRTRAPTSASSCG